MFQRCHGVARVLNGHAVILPENFCGQMGGRLCSTRLGGVNLGLDANDLLGKL
jgi:hypothetical protein